MSAAAQRSMPVRPADLGGARMHGADADAAPVARKPRKRPPETLGECRPGDVVVADGETLVVTAHLNGAPFVRSLDGTGPRPMPRDTPIAECVELR